MAGLTAPGVGSGLDVNSLVSQLMALERRPIALLDTRESGLKAELSAFGTLKGALSALQTAAANLAKAEKFSATKATVADSTIYTASSSAAASPGSYDIEVQSLAQAQKLRSASLSTSGAIGSGEITIEFGTYRTVDADNTVFDLNASKAAATITIDPAADTLAEIRDAINGANAGVTATIVGDGTAGRLFVTSNSTGLANQLRISVNDDDGNDTDNLGLSQLVYDGTRTAGANGTRNLTQWTAAADASVIIDGVNISSSSNSISTAISGVTLNLTEQSDPGVTSRLTIAADASVAKSTIESFVKAYNDYNKTLRELTAYDAVSKKAATLQGDSTALSVQRQLKSIVTGSVAGLGDISRLADIGISFQQDGSLLVDAAELDAAVNDADLDIAGLFIESGGVKGLAKQMDDAIDALLDSEGMLSSRTEGINSTIKNVGKRREALELRMEAIEKRYLAQFVALDSLIASMNQTSSFLQQQLANLPTIGGKE